MPEAESVARALGVLLGVVVRVDEGVPVELGVALKDCVIERVWLVDGDPDTLWELETESEGVELCVIVALAEAVPLDDGVLEIEGVEDAVSEGVSAALGVADRDGVGDGVGDAEPVPL